MTTRSLLLTSVGPMGGALVGVGVMAVVDEIVFHQLLGWHHFYDRATPAIDLVSDGILHSIELICLVAGFATLINSQRNPVLTIKPAIAGQRLPVCRVLRAAISALFSDEKSAQEVFQ